MFYACVFNCRDILCCLISFSGRVYSIFFMRINEFCVYMRFIVSLRWKGKGMKMKDEEILCVCFDDYVRWCEYEKVTVFI